MEGLPVNIVREANVGLMLTQRHNTTDPENTIREGVIMLYNDATGLWLDDVWWALVKKK